MVRSSFVGRTFWGLQFGRAASGGALALQPPCATRSAPEFEGAWRRSALARSCRALTGSDQSNEDVMYSKMWRIKRCCVLKNVGYTTSFNTQHLSLRSYWRVSRSARIRLPLHSSSSHPNWISPSHPHGISIFFFSIKIVSCNLLLTNCILQPPFNPEFFWGQFSRQPFLAWKKRANIQVGLDWNRTCPGALKGGIESRVSCKLDMSRLQ